MPTRRINFLEQHQPPLPEPPRKRRRVLFLIALILGLLLLVSVLRGVVSSNLPEDPAAYDPVTLEPVKPKGLLARIKQFVFGTEAKLEGQKDDRINVLLMGQGGIGHDGPFLTDTIIIASIQPSTKQVSMVSIPRDLGVEIPGYGMRKINNANAFGEVEKKNLGPALATKVIQETFDIDIHYYVRVDFQAFVDIVDEVGGVRVDVERGFTDFEYPAPNHLYQTISFAAGEQTMDGETALMYARSRHGNNGEGSDFARAKRQQRVILALKEKVLSFDTLANPVHINNILKTLDEHIVTNMEFSDIIALLKLGKELDTSNIITVVLDNGVNGYLQNGFTTTGAFILEPTAGNFDDINALIDGIFDKPELATQNETPEQEKPAFTPANIEIQNATWRAGMAARTRATLSQKGLTVTAVGNTIERPLQNSGIYQLSEKPMTDVLETVKATLNIPIKQSLPDNEFASSTTDVLIILGDDFVE